MPTAELARPVRPQRPVALRILPGLLVSFGAAGVSIALGSWIAGLSAMLVAILLGAVLSNLTGPQSPIMQQLQPGLAVASRRLLRLGVVLLGLQLALSDIVALGWPIIVGVVVIVAGTMTVTIALGRLLKVGPEQSLLIAGGFSICGAAAVGGVDAVLAKRKDAEAATAVALVVIFGTLMIGVMPGLTGMLGLDPETAGIWTGASTHEVAQVVAAAGIIGPQALKVAVLVKLARVLMLAPVMAIISIQQRSIAAPEPGRKRPPLVPLFVIGFIAMVGLRSLGVLPDIVLAGAKVAETWLLAAAMFALGSAMHFSVLMKAGRRPVALAALATVAVMALGGGVAFAEHFLAA